MRLDTALEIIESGEQPERLSEAAIVLAAAFRQFQRTVLAYGSNKVRMHAAHHDLVDWP